MRSYLLQMLFFSTAAYGQPPPADLILVNAKMFTADTDRPLAAALAIRGERIVAVGTTAEIDSLAEELRACFSPDAVNQDQVLMRARPSCGPIARSGGLTQRSGRVAS